LPAGAGTAPPPYCPGSADVLVGKKGGAGGQGRRGRRRSQEISLSTTTKWSRKKETVLRKVSGIEHPAPGDYAGCYSRSVWQLPDGLQALEKRGEGFSAR
jgi:hypothetical protein